MSLGQQLAPHLPFLRRYGRALTGSQSHGDRYVRATLEAIVAAPEEFPRDVDPRLGLYRTFQAIWSSANADEMDPGNDGRPRFSANHAGGIVGGISSGQPIIARFAVKPTSSILTPRRSITRDGAATDVVTKGRHDPCVGIRAVPVGEAMMACVLADHFLRHRGQVG